MFLRLVWALAALVACVQAGSFYILHSPKNLVFKGESKVDQSLLKDIYSAALGYTAKPSNWKGMSYDSPFNLPEAVVAVIVEGVDNVDLTEGKKLILNDDKYEEFTWQTLSGRLQPRDNDNFLVRISLADGVDALGQSALGELKPNSTDELLVKAPSLKDMKNNVFLEELQMLHAIADKVKTDVKPDGKSDVFWFVISGLKPVLDAHENNSIAAKEALNLLDETLKDVSKAFRHVYKNKVLITAFTNTAILDRQTRDIKKDEETPTNKENSGASNKEHEDEYTEEKLPEANYENLAPTYKEDYPVVFNIVLWFMVVFFFSLLAICITIADMDPGRDSIIYRMTSNRMKKDN